MKIYTYGLTLAMAAIPLMAFAWVTDSEVLLRSYMHFNLAQEVHAQAAALARNLNPADAAQIREVADDWLQMEIEIMREGLESQFGDEARDRFEAFVGNYTTAESAGDETYLDYLAGSARLRETPPDYEALRRLVLDRWLDEPLAAGTRLLSEMQTWADVRAKQSGTPQLAVWLERDQRPAPPASPPEPVDPLAAAEAPPPAWDAPQVPSGSALDAFSQRRVERREQAMQSAQAGMQQMAMERQAAEQEYGAKKMAEAQADAEAMRAQAQKLAAVEAEALAQRENSWGNRIKRIVGGTVSAGLGAFTGGVGAEAGRRAADELFR